MPAGVTFLHRQAWIPVLPGFLYETTWLVAIFTTVIFIYLYRLARPSLFVQLYLTSMVVKLISYLGYNLVMVLEEPSGAMTNVVYFLFVYTAFTVVEIGFLYRKIRAS